MGKLTQGRSRKSLRKSCGDMSSAISSLVLVGGQRLFDWPDGQQIEKSGREVARANRSQQPESEKGQQTSDTCGRSSSGLSGPIVQPTSSESKLCRSNGGIKSQKTLKALVTPHGRKLEQRRYSDGGESFGLPALAAREWRDRSRGRILSSLDRGDGVAKRICRLSPTLHSSEEIVGLNHWFGLWMMGFDERWSSTVPETPSSRKSRRNS